MKVRDWLPLREIDRQLHNARLVKLRHRRRSEITSLPDGVFVWCPTFDKRPLKVSGGDLFPWSHGGYGSAVETLDLSGAIYALTPLPIVSTIEAGYRSI